MSNKYFAVTSNNGLISANLTAASLREVIAELKDAIANGTAEVWHDNGYCDLDFYLGVNCDGLSYEKALELCSENGAEFAWGSTSDDCWVIYSVAV